jgi:AAA15 family ATPase/GTPase
VEINNRSFAEAKDFVRREVGTLFIEKTKENVPFISVLAQFNGVKSGNVIKWFKRIHVIQGGIESYGSRSLTIKLFETNPTFKNWALEILSALQIHDVRIIEEDNDVGDFSESADADFKEAITKLSIWIKKSRAKRKIIQIVKKPEGGSQEYIMPLMFESDGTKKLLYLLGPIFDVIVKEKILIIDEFDSKFHSLLSKYLIDLYHKTNLKNSQLILTCHDTNLLTKELLRRDQIWFLEKNKQQESELYSLLEYKEHYTRKEDSYSKDYLSGKYGAIPLLSSIEDLKCF